MKTIIYYFSATGNSLNVALDLADKLGNTKVVSILETENQDLDLSFDRIGLVFPVCMWGIPSIVSRFLQRLGNIDHNEYIFAIATYKSSPGAVLNQLQTKLKRVNSNLSAGFTVCMPGNNIIYYNVEADDVQQLKFKNMNIKLDDIAFKINIKQQNQYKSKSIIKRFLLTKFLHKLIIDSYPKADKNYWVNEDCIGCGTCAKVCPAKNIVVTDKGPTWLHKCEQCTACINLCPKQAIQFSKYTTEKKRYKNPFVRLNDLQQNK
jgi:ferredoxin/flavodoxin